MGLIDVAIVVVFLLKAFGLIEVSWWIVSIPFALVCIGMWNK